MSRFRIVPHDPSFSNGELTPTLKAKHAEAHRSHQTVLDKGLHRTRVIGPRRPPLTPRRHLPAGYSREYERDVTLTDGRVAHVRPIVPEDVDELRTRVAHADAETLRNRFLGGRPPSKEDEFQHLVHVDYDRRFAVVAISPDRRGVGIARYEAIASDRAEVAVAVDPGWRRIGLATNLLRVLAEAALDHGISSFALDFFVDNVDVSSILRQSQLPVTRQSADGVIDAEIDLGAVAQELPQPPGQGSRSAGS